MRIGIDLDNVVYPFVEEFTEYVENFYPQFDPKPVTAWEFYKEWGMSTTFFLGVMQEACERGKLFHDGAVTQECRAAINVCLQHHELVVVTHRGKYAEAATLEWLSNRDLWVSEVHLAEDKTQFGLDVLLDDASHNIEAAHRAGILAVVWDQPWNRHIPTVDDLDITRVMPMRVKSWREFVQLISNLEAAHARVDEVLSSMGFAASLEVTPGPFETYDFSTLPDDMTPDVIALEDAPYETLVVDPETGGAKGSKPARMDLLPYDVLLEVATHYGVGASKYEARNWERGYSYSLSFAALMRHLGAWWQGEDLDAETGSSHLNAVIFHAFSLRAFELRGIGTDDRPGGVTKDSSLG